MGIIIFLCTKTGSIHHIDARLFVCLFVCLFLKSSVLGSVKNILLFRKKL